MGTRVVKATKLRRLSLPTQELIQGQWWSIILQQRPLPVNCVWSEGWHGEGAVGERECVCVCVCVWRDRERAATG